ncbi:glycosyltransferase [Nakamurella flavida]|uniref:Glycosyltransferase n=1 Tax=Nakamurella flavida TaxID=363630 RepID=A0A939C7H3_9ACTN|nr:glycosyltransferase [Nakamurella flavida]MBM9478172.1 glycosyltransferase [Nakamurella flavida]MDP9778606.1 glycosyltransferase involved in cell wall biosynthesis [Nakamurella flavida]
MSMRPLASTAEIGAGNTLKILIIAGLRYPIREPFIGGLEAHTAALAQGLRRRGHSVVVVGAQGSDPSLVDVTIGSLPHPTNGERPDTSQDPAFQAAEDALFETLMGRLATGMLGSFDLIHNNSLHPLPVQRAPGLPCPMVTTLHTPPLPWAERVLSGLSRERDVEFLAVSGATARAWQPLIHPGVVHNGVDMDAWALGPGGPGAVWTGRIAPEKAPHLAIAMARAAGLPLTLAGPVIDHHYYDRQIRPHLDGTVRHIGHLTQEDLVELVGSSAVALVTPVWDEPYGMVVAEAMACGTPVVALARGGIPEILDGFSGRLLAPADARGLDAAEMAAAVTAIGEAVRLDRAGVRGQALRRCSSDRMLDDYEAVYQGFVRRWAA